MVATRVVWIPLLSLVEKESLAGNPFKNCHVFDGSKGLMNLKSAMPCVRNYSST